LKEIETGIEAIHKITGEHKFNGSMHDLNEDEE
jgi:hypothetical protein